jgi:antitoxin component YwqK of YwqJK toxin-antitoxin module
VEQPYLAWADRDDVDRRVTSVAQSELDYEEGEGRYVYDGRPFTGFSATRYPDGRLESLTGFTDGIEHGLTVGWHPNGQLRRYAETAESVYHGVVAEWAEDAALLRVTRYNLGLEIDPTGDPSWRGFGSHLNRDLRATA